jgi:hypothetical protein
MLGTTRLGQRDTLVLAYSAVLLVAVSCQIVAGIETRQPDPQASGCVLPAGNGPQVRIANLVPTGDVVDVCIRPAGTASWGRPVLLNGGVVDGGLGCQALLGGAPGFAYGQVSTAFTAPAASIDVKMVPGGSTCDTGALTEGDGLTLAANATTTLVRIGGNGVAQQIVALGENDAGPDSNNLRIRFVHAMPGTGPLDVGVSASAQLPATVGGNLLSAPLQFGGSSAGDTSNIGAIEDNGYLSIIPTTFNIGLAPDGGGGKAIILQPFSSGKAATFSLYAVGVAGDNAHPVRGILCAEDAAVKGPNALLMSCSGSPLPTISVDIFNPALYGPNAPYNTVRTPAVPQAIQQRSSDIMCVVELDALADRQNVINQALPSNGGPFPYSYAITTNLSTPFTNPAAQNGQVPPAPTTPPCGGSVPSSNVDDVFTCVEQRCSTKGPGDDSGQLQTTTQCLSDQCAIPFANLLGQSQACFDCLLVYFASEEQWGTSKTACLTDTRPPLGFEGQNSSMILSHYPLSNSDALILPSTNYRRAVLYSQVQLEDQTVDFYCGFFITTLISSDLPYVGVYGSGQTTSVNAYQAEQLYEAQQLVSYVQQKSQGRPAIVVGDWRSSAAPADGGAGPQGLSQGTMQYLLGVQGWVPANTPTWQPQCNYCPGSQNVYNGPNDSYFVEQPFLVSWTGDPTQATTDESLLFAQNTVPLGGDAGLGPVSPYYGLNIRVLRPQH